MCGTRSAQTTFLTYYIDSFLGNSLFRYGRFVTERFLSALYRFARSEDLWERRIAILATCYFIVRGRFKDTLAISEILLGDEHDLIHKAVGWMLREVGKRDVGVLEGFLRKHYKKMPRTMLRYSIERLSEGKRQDYLKGRV